MSSVHVCYVESSKWETQTEDSIWSFLWDTSTMRRVSFSICVINYSLLICCSVWIIHMLHSFCALPSRRSESVNVSVCCPQESDGSLPYLLVLCGDHGMSETGSHGGSSEPEVNTPLVLISPAFKRKGKLHAEIRDSDEEPAVLTHITVIVAPPTKYFHQELFINFLLCNSCCSHTVFLL